MRNDGRAGGLPAGLAGPVAVGAGGGAGRRRVLLVVGDADTRRHVESVCAALAVPTGTVSGPAELPRLRGAQDLVVIDLDVVPGATGWSGATGSNGPTGLPDLGPAPVLLASAPPTPEQLRTAAALGAREVLRLPEDHLRLADRVADFADGSAAAGRVVAFLPGRGGAGASVLATAFARRAARRGHGTLLVDGDPLGGGLDLLLGAEELPGLRWPELARVRGLLPAATVPFGLPRVDGVRLLSQARAAATGDAALPAEALAAVVESGRRRIDLVVVDAPRWPAGSVADLACDLVCVITTADVNAVAATCRVVEPLREAGAAVGLVVRGPAPGGLRAEQVAEVLGVPLLGFLRPEPGLAAGLERREPPGIRGRGPLATAADALLDRLDVPRRGWGGDGSHE